jgi:hypothetical protein
MTSIIKKFEIGQTYTCRFVGQSDSKIQITVASRTTHTIKTTTGKTFRINQGLAERNGAEVIFPLGRYSMAPTMEAK